MLGAQLGRGVLPTLPSSLRVAMPTGQAQRDEHKSLRGTGIPTRLQSSSMRTNSQSRQYCASRRSATAPADIPAPAGGSRGSKKTTDGAVPRAKEVRPPVLPQGTPAMAAAHSQWVVRSVVRPRSERCATPKESNEAAARRPSSDSRRLGTSDRPHSSARPRSNRRQVRAEPEPEPEVEPATPTLSGELDRSLSELIDSKEGKVFAKPLAKRWQGLVACPLDLSIVRQRIATGVYGEGSTLLACVANDVRQIWENTRNVFGELRASQCKNAAVCAQRFETSLALVARQFELEVPDMPPDVGRSLPQLSTATVCSPCAVQSRVPSQPCERTGLVFDEMMLRHRDMADKNFKHPEKPQRIARIFKEMWKHGLVDRCEHVRSRRATREELQAVHSDELIDKIDEVASQSRKAQSNAANDMDMTNSLYFNQSTTECAYLAAGSVVEMTRRVLEGKLANGVAVVRPPGHHATCGCSMGFCVFNNVAVAARAAMREHWGGARRALILDWDVHHGNGTQKIFETDSSVLYISIHRYDDGEFFPGGTRGHFANAGSGKGRGYIVNIPWDCPGGRDGVPGDADYLLAFEQIVEPICKEFRPDFVLVSAGFDAAVGDPLGGCQVTPGGFYELTRRLQGLPTAKGRVIVVLEGGYNLKSTARSITACTSALLGDACPSFDNVSKQVRTTDNGTGIGKRPNAPKLMQPGDTMTDTDVSTDDLPKPPAIVAPEMNCSGATIESAVTVQGDEPVQTARPRFRDRVEEVKASISVYWSSLRGEPSQPIRSLSLSTDGLVPGQQIRLKCGNTYRRISPSVAKLARTGPPGVKLVHEWSLCVCLADEDDAAGVELSKKVARVEFRLDASFNSAVIVMLRPPFAVARRSWTTGTVGVTVFFKPSTVTDLVTAPEAWGSNVQNGSRGYGRRCRPSGSALRPAELSHVLSFAEGGCSTVYTISIEEEAPTAKPTSELLLAATPTDSTDADDWRLMTPQERRRAALRRRREENARRRNIADGKACEESVVGSLFFGR